MMQCLVPLTEEQFRKTIENVGYSSVTLQSGIDDLKKWAIDQKRFPETIINEPDSFYSLMLMGCKGNMELSKKKLEAYYYSRNKYPVLFSKNPFDESILATSGTVLIATLPKPTSEGSRITMICPSDPDPKKYDLITGVLRLLLLIELRGREEGVYNGEWVIFDARNITFGHLFKVLVPTVLKSMLEYIQNVLSARIKGIIVINAPKFIERAINSFIKPLLKKKIAQRIFVYSMGGSVVDNHFPQRLLPNEYGGEEKSLQDLSDMWLNKGKMEKEWLAKVLTQKVKDDVKPKGSYFSGFKFFSSD